MNDAPWASKAKGEARILRSMRFDNVRLLVADVGACFRFYRDVLGLEPHEGSEAETVFASLGVDEHVDIGLFARQLQPRADDEPPSGDRAVLVLRVADVHDFVARVAAAGGGFATSPTDQPWGGRTAHSRDPEGNLIELLGAGRPA